MGFDLAIAVYFVWEAHDIKYIQLVSLTSNCSSIKLLWGGFMKF